MAALAQVLATVTARRAVLISTIDVYQPAIGVDEMDPPDFDGAGVVRHPPRMVRGVLRIKVR